MESKEPSRRLRGVAAFAFSLAAALFVLPAHAQDTSAKKSPAKTTAKPKDKSNLMTRDELRVCMDDQDRLAQLGNKVKTEQTALDRQRAEVQTLDSELERKRAALDPADEAAKHALVDEFIKRDQFVDSYNTRLAAVRQDGTTYETQRQGWLERCTRKDYDEMDEAAIKKERAKAAGARK